ncbi:putative hydrophobin [Lyophyllum shimeji]|uniref:Hydrophobin n=1 Tax=Lyophyllum shimeji TaxID=47721 RepID=A0A9P3PVH1_LYOSH|nr:putative hydrophobin [Lyophyllum shimeji]
MFARISTVFFIALCASATVLPRTDVDNTVSQCNTGDIHCCNSVQEANHPYVGHLAGLLGISMGDISGQVGLTCNPVGVHGGKAGVSCSQQPVCCTGNSFSGLIVVGCSPININF